MQHVKITIGGVSVRAKLRDTPTAQRIMQHLPIHSIASTWGDEIYFETDVETGREGDAKSVVEAGEIAFWAEKDIVAIGFGPTPISEGPEIRLMHPVNIWADAVDDVKAFATVHAGAAVIVEAAD